MMMAIHSRRGDMEAAEEVLVRQLHEWQWTGAGDSSCSLQCHTEAQMKPLSTYTVTQ